MNHAEKRSRVAMIALLAVAAAWPLLLGALDEHGHDHAPASTPDEHGHIHAPATSTKKDNHDHDAHGHEEHSDEVTLTPEAIKQHGIRIEPAKRLALDAVFTAPARVAFNAEAMAHVGTPVEGRVAEIRAKLGDSVKQGDVLLVIDSPTLGEAQSEFLQRRADVEVAKTSLEVAQTMYERSKGLLEGKGLSLGEFQRREGEFKIARSGLIAAESAAQAAENRLHLYGMRQQGVNALLGSGEIDARYQVRAPLAGDVIDREVTLGEVVGPDREALMILADTGTLWVMADVPEARMPQVKVGVPARARFTALGEKVFSGTVAYVAPQMNVATRTGSVRVELANDESGLQPGMFGQVEFSAMRDDLATTAATLVVPEAAVQTVEGGPAVFVPVPGEANTFAKRALAVGPRVGGWIPVISGLKEGEPIVTRGSFILKAELGKAGAAHEH